MLVKNGDGESFEPLRPPSCKKMKPAVGHLSVTARLIFSVRHVRALYYPLPSARVSEFAPVYPLLSASAAACFVRSFCLKHKLFKNSSLNRSHFNCRRCYEHFRVQLSNMFVSSMLLLLLLRGELQQTPLLDVFLHPPPTTTLWVVYK